LKVSVSLEKSEGAAAPLAKFVLSAGGTIAEDVFRRVLTAYAPPRRQFIAGHAQPIREVRVPLAAALLACGALGKANVALFADKAAQKTIRDAAWTCKASGLYPFQKSGAEFLRSRRRAILADQMGVGKTIQALAAIDERKPALAIVPPIVLGNWYAEARKWRPDLATSIWKRPYSVFPEPGELRIATFSSLPIESVEERTLCPFCEKMTALEIEERQGPPFDPGTFAVCECSKDRGGCGQRFARAEDAQMANVWGGERPKHPVQLIVDEAHYIKSRKAKRTIAVRAIASQCSSVWLLTGTPLLNTPEELWNLCQAMPGRSSIEPNMLARFDSAAQDTFGSWQRFVKIFHGKPKKYGGYEWSEAGDVDDEARVRLGALMLRRMRADVLPDLPRKTRRFLDVEVDERGLPSWGKPDDLARMSDDQVLAECAPERSLSSVRRELALRKVASLLALVEEHEEEGEPIVVFSYHRTPVEQLGARPGWACITGSTPAHERTAIVAAFQAGKLKGVAGTTGAMGVGVTLTAAASVAFLDRDFVPAQNLQCEDRLARIGQTRGVIVTIFQSRHPVDLRVRDVLLRKERLLESLALGEEEVASEVAFAGKKAAP
jgi:SNF2 family DNA or RNA helicase